MATPKRGRSPDFRLRAYDKRAKKGTNVGAGWTAENGSINVVIDPFIVLRQRENYSFHLYPVDAVGRAKVEREAGDVGPEDAG